MMMMMMMEMDENHSTAGSTNSSSSRRHDMLPLAVTTKPTTTMDGFVEHRLLDAFLKASNACDKFFNCAYVTKQLEEEWHQEHVLAVPDVITGGVGVDASTTTTTAMAMNRVWNKMETSFQVEVYRQFLFDESSFDDNNSDGEDEISGRDGTKELTLLLPFCGNESDAASIPDLQRTRS